MSELPQVEIFTDGACKGNPGPGGWGALIQRASDIDWAWLGEPHTLGLTAGASAPEVLVTEVIEALKQRFAVTIEEAEHVVEDMVFKLPRALVA